MSHISKDQIIYLAGLYAEDLPYPEEEISALKHIRECEDCYNDFCCAVVAYEATTPEAIARVLPINKATFSLASSAKAVIRVVSEAISVTMEQIGDNLSWLFEPSLAFAGARGADGTEEVSGIACLEDVNSRYTFVRFNAETGELHIQIDTEEAAMIPEKISLRFPDGSIMELDLTRGDRFIIADAKDLPGKDFEIVFS